MIWLYITLVWFAFVRLQDYSYERSKRYRGIVAPVWIQVSVFFVHWIIFGWIPYLIIKWMLTA